MGMGMGMGIGFMGMSYSDNIQRLVKLAKRGYQPAQLLLAVTDLTRVFSTLVPEAMTEMAKLDVVNALTSASGGNPAFAKQTIHNIIEKLTVIENWLDIQGDGVGTGNKEAA